MALSRNNPPAITIIAAETAGQYSIAASCFESSAAINPSQPYIKNLPRWYCHCDPALMLLPHPPPHADWHATTGPHMTRQWVRLPARPPRKNTANTPPRWENAAEQCANNASIVPDSIDYQATCFDLHQVGAYQRNRTAVGNELYGKHRLYNSRAKF